jgi:hypothetical protein
MEGVRFFSGSEEENPRCSLCAWITLIKLKAEEGFKHASAAKFLREAYEAENGCWLVRLGVKGLFLENSCVLWKSFPEWPYLHFVGTVKLYL